MQRFLLVLVLGLLSLSPQSAQSAQSAQQPQEKSPAASWRSLSEASRSMWVDGFQAGAVFVGDSLVAALAGVTTADTAGLEATHPTPAQVQALTDAIRAVETSAGNKFGSRRVAEAVTALFEDPANEQIHVQAMITVATLRLTGRPQSDIDAALASWRTLFAPAK